MLEIVVALGIINTIWLGVTMFWIYHVEKKGLELKRDLQGELLREIWDESNKIDEWTEVIEKRIVRHEQTTKQEIKEAMESLGYTYLAEVTATIPGKWVKKGDKN